MTSRVCCLASVCALTCCFAFTCLSSDDIQIGETKESVVKKLGKPSISAPSANKEFCYFKRANVDFVDGKVVSVEWLSDEDIAAQKQRDEQGRILLEKQKEEARKLQRQQEEDALRLQQQQLAEAERNRARDQRLAEEGAKRNRALYDKEQKAQLRKMEATYGVPQIRIEDNR